MVETEFRIPFFRPRHSTGVVASLRDVVAAGRHLCAMTSDGRLMSCSYFRDEESEPVTINGFLDTWLNSIVFNQMRNLTINDIEQCKTCSNVYKCHTGCRAAAKYFTGSINKADPLTCPFYKETKFDYPI